MLDLPATADHGVDMATTGIETLVRQVREALARGDAARAEALCRECVAIDPAREDALAFLAMRAIERGTGREVTPLFERATALKPAAAILHFHHGTVLESLGSPREARDAYARAVAADPAMLLARFWLAATEAALGLDDEALATRVRAIADAERTGFVRELAHQPPHARRRIDEAVASVRAARGRAIEAAIGGAPVSPRVRRAFERYLGRDAFAPNHPLQQPSFLLVPDLPATPWRDRADFPFLAQIEAATDAIRAEMLAMLADETQLAPYVDMPDEAPAAPMWRELNRSPRWSACHLYRHGERVEPHASRCPATMAALDALPLMRVPAHSPEALYSVLKPRTRIPPHTGVMNGRLTVHLPLVVPPDCGALRVGSEARGWSEGRCLVFDDSIVHEAWNDSDATRVVLIFDVWDPQLAPEERAALAAGIAAVGDFHRRHRAYDATHET